MKCVLILDDDNDILYLVKKVLSVNGYRTETMSVWEHFTMSVQQCKPDLILMDISLAGANGTDLCRQLKKEMKTQNIPVLLFSSDIEIAKKANECGASGYVSKPFMIKDLLNAVEKNILQNQ